MERIKYKVIDMDKYYTVAVNDFMATGGDGYDFTKAKNMKDTMLVMRDEIIEEWKNNGINTTTENLLIAGVDDTKENVKPGDNGKPTTEEPSSNNNSNLPMTGGQNPMNMAIFAIIISGIGYVMVKKNKKEKVS